MTETPDSSQRRPYGRWIPWASLLARLLLAFMWFWYARTKVFNLDGVVTSVRHFQILPEWAIKPWAYSQPYVEMALVILLVVGLGTRWAAALSILLLLAFIIGFVALWVRGIDLSSCGCQNPGVVLPDSTPNYTWEIVRDLLFALPAVWLVVFPRAPFSLDRMLDPLPPR